ncbi:MAG: hypothetical protein KKD29_03905 [Candidatus Omnitrophica bacterium]|nr:hypothetical protein [Candidatus Omnitrophota bacterium]MBU4488330.1 hypothetical protein [Candidatus Omnitrophota bacterium]MCG2704980.1 hypothetical protein [Candidatus Omnitrophota bacterium]
MYTGKIKRFLILLSMFLLHAMFFAPAPSAEDLYGPHIIVEVKVRPVCRLTIDRETIKKILAEYEGHLRGIALQECAKEYVAQFRLTSIEGQTYTEVMLSQ